MKTQSCIIVGASHAGSQVAIALRQKGWKGSITLLGAEKDLPYHRPPLSKDLLSGAKDFEDILIRPSGTYDIAKVTMKLGVCIKSINRSKKTILSEDGLEISYDKLILATGARARNISIPGNELKKVFYLRNSKDVEAIKGQLKPGKKCIIIGGGYIGLETAASLTKKGVKVTLLEAMDRILQRVTTPVMSDFFRRIHTEEGVEIVESEIAVSICKQNDMLTVNSSAGNKYTADFVIVGIGVIPNMELAKEAGLKVGNGINVNRFCQTNDPDIYAIGDVAWHHNIKYDLDLRLESVPNATEQAKTVALHINGTEKPYDSLPWFWSDQFDLKLQIAGLFQGFDEIVLRGNPLQGRQLSVFYFKGDQLLAVDSVNDPKSFMFTRVTLSKQLHLDKSILADSNIDIRKAVITSKTSEND